MSIDLWTSAAFHTEVTAWVQQALATRGVRLTGAWSQPHARVWSSTLSFETGDGRVWFKVNGVGTAHEASLLRLLDRLSPGLAPEVLAVDERRGWSLSRDGGPMLREVAPPDQLWSRWEGVVARYAEAQIGLSAHRDEVLATGVVEVSPATVPGLARGLLDELAATSVADGGLTVEDAARIEDVLPRLAEWCAALAAAGVPDSVQHDDLHSGNVCWPGSLEGARVIDWGDTTWGHPLTTMLGTMNSIAHHAGLLVEGQPVEDPRVLRVRDAYLEPFTVYADRADLVRCVALARRTGCVGKALAYRAALAGQQLSAHAQYDFPVRDWFVGLLDEG